MECIETHKIFEGTQEVWSHKSAVLGCDMRFGVYLPPQAQKQKCPVVYWLSGLTCTEQNFITKAGAAQWAAKYGIIVIAPDTSPRGEYVANDPAYDLGQGAGFYLNATRAPWVPHYHMFDYVTEELPALIAAHFPVNNKRGIFGHSMGGHGALICALKKPDYYDSVSAFSPICAPSQVPWGQKAFSHYLGDDPQDWQAWDACALLSGAKKTCVMLVDQGENDEFLNQLQPQKLQEAAAIGGHDLSLRMHAGYDHSYYFIATFLEDHFKFHAGAFGSDV